MSGVGHCIRGKIESGIIGKDYGQELLDKIDEVEKMLQNFPEMESSKAFDDMTNRVKEWQINKKRQYIKSIQAEKRIYEQAKQHPKGTLDGLVSTLTYDLSGHAWGLNVEKLAESIRAESYGDMPTLALNMTSGKFGMSKNVKGGIKFVKALFGDDTDEIGSKMAKEWKQTTERLRKRFIAAGGDIGELENWRLPQSHDADRIMSVSKDEWVNFIFPLLDRKKMIDNKTGWPLSKENLQKVLQESYETLSSRGLNKYSQSKRDVLATKYSDSRVLHFKDADSWLAYNQRFGNGDPMLTASQYVENMAQDIGFMETWGPDPEALKERILNKVRREETLDDLKKAGKVIKKIEYFNRIWDEVTGEASIPVQTNLVAAHFNSGVRNLLMAAQLGSAFLTQFSDVACSMWTANFNGLSKMDIPKNLFSLMTSNKKRDFAMHIGLGADEIVNILGGRTAGTTRFLGDILPEKGWTQRVASAVIKASLLERMTMAGKKAFSLDFSKCLADSMPTEFGKLNVALKHCFERYGISPEEWKKLGSLNEKVLDDFSGAKYLNLVKLAKEDQTLASKISNMIFTERDFAIIDSNVRTRAFMTQGNKRGTFMGEALRYMAMYKTFPVTVLTHHISRMIDIEGTGSKLGYAGGLFAAMTMSGYFTVQAKLLVSGKKPAQSDKWNTWVEFMLAGGALGVMGDIFAGETRGNFIEDKLLAAAGPGFSLAKDTYDLTIGNARKAMSRRQESNFAGDAAKFFKRYTPGTNLWYTRLATERYLTDKLQLLADRKTRQRFHDSEKAQRRRYGRGYWWKPGENKPNF